MTQILNIIVIAAHPDEAEIYAGAHLLCMQNWAIESNSYL